ncbi:MAG: hypothetical protein Q9184_005896, partial [Pyrenodesmia sp. 2 TL-2023]
MVSTRGQRPLVPSAADNEVLSTPDIGIDVKSAGAPDATAEATETSKRGRTQNDGRLRKRRRSPLPTADEQEPSNKRSNPRKAPSPVAKRTATTNVNAGASREKVASTVTRRGRRIGDQSLESAAPGGAEGEDHGVLEQEPHAPQQPAEAQGHGELGDANGIAQISPDMNAVMSQIINHGQSVDSQYALHGEPAASADTESFFPQSASSLLRTQSLPILDNLAVQILATFAHSSYQEILALTSDNTTEPGTAYSILKSLFDHTKKVYSIREPLLSSQELGFNGNEQVEIIRKANLATFVSSVFGSQDVGFYHLNEIFLDTFVADGSRLLKNQAGLFLDLKTQAYISAIAHGERSREDILHDLFPDGLEHSLLNRRPGGKQLSPGEADFIQRVNNRKKTLLEEPMTAEAVAQLPLKYAWGDFLRDLSSYLSKNFNIIVGAS